MSTSTETRRRSPVPQALATSARASLRAFPTGQFLSAGADALQRTRTFGVAVVYLALLAAADYLAFWLRFDGRIPPTEWALFLGTGPWLLAITAAAFIPFDLYRSSWRYTGIWDLRNLVTAVALSAVAFSVLVYRVFGERGYPRSVVILWAVLSVSLIGGLRFLRRFVTETFRGTRGDRVLIIGAGNAGEMMARELRRLGHEPIGFIDDDESKQGQTIQRTRVLGTAADLGRIVATKRPDEVLIAIPTAGPATIRRFMTEIEQCKVPITTVPTMREILDGRAAAHHVRPVAVEDLLPRAPVTLVTDIDFSAHGEHLLLTFDDGGKSALHIGDELCRRGWRGHFLVTTKLAGTAGFLSRSDIVTLRRAGHLVGSHSHTHPDIFPVLSWPAMCEEWRTSAAILSDWLGERCTLASLPGGDFSKAVGESAAACGFTHFFTSEPRLVPWQEQGCHILGRMFVTTSTRTERVRDAAALRGWQAALARRRCSVMLRSACPPLYRCYVRLRTRPLSVPA